jgi:hypothetical protein
VGPRAVLDAVVKRKSPSPRRESNPRTPIIKPVAQLYTDWAITVLEIRVLRRIFGPSREEVASGWRRLRSKMFHNLRFAKYY